MRVAIITENFLPKLDGVTKDLTILLEHLHTTGHQALLLGPASGIDEYAGAEIRGTLGIPLPFYPELKFNFFRPLFIRRLRAFQPDIVHLVDPVVLGAAGLVVARLLDIPLVSSYHTNLAAYCSYFGFPSFARPMWAYNRFIHNKCSLIFCQSRSTAMMLNWQGFHNVRVWPGGVDTDLFRPERRSAALRASWLQNRTEPGKKVALLYVGRLSWEKNLHLLVQAYQRMDHRHCHLVIVGNGPARAELEKEFSGLPVTFTGYLRGEALATAYASADVFAFPSRTETLGLVVLEAMASGLPVVGLLAEGVRDQVHNEYSGLLLDTQKLNEREQVEGYRALLERSISDDQARQVMGQAAFLEAQQRTWYRSMECVVQGYYEVIHRTPVIEPIVS